MSLCYICFSFVKLHDVSHNVTAPRVLFCVKTTHLELQHLSRLFVSANLITPVNTTTSFYSMYSFFSFS